MRSVGEGRNTASRSAGAHDGNLLGEKYLFDRQAFSGQGDEVFAAGGDGLERKSSSRKPGLQDSPVVRKRDSGIEKIGPNPLGTPVRLEVTVDHLPNPGGIAHSLSENLSFPARIKKVRLFFDPRWKGKI